MDEITKKYLDAMQKAKSDYEKALTALRNEADNGIICCVSCSPRARPITADYSRASRAAFDMLADSTDPLVRFIGKQCRTAPDHAQTVVAALPATAEKLWDIADRESWCGDFDNLLIRAAQAGALPGWSAARGEMMDRLWHGEVWRSRVGRAELRHAMKLVDAVVRASG